MTPQELHAGFMAFVEKEDETGARTFLIEHLNEFPEETRDKIAFAFFTEAAAKQGEEMKAVMDMRAEGTKLLQEMDEKEKILDEVEQAHQIKAGI